MTDLEKLLTSINDNLTTLVDDSLSRTEKFGVVSRIEKFALAISIALILLIIAVVASA